MIATMMGGFRCSKNITIFTKTNIRTVFLSSIYMADKQTLSKLRKRTGYPFINCRKALDKFENHIDKAEEWLRAEAQKEGWARAHTVQHRAMSNGLVSVAFDRQAAAVVEVNCETDFVSQNNQFQKLVGQVTLGCLNHYKSNAESKLHIDQTSLKSLPLDGKTVADAVAMIVGNIGENMQVNRCTILRAPDGYKLATYVHAAGLGRAVQSTNCLMGKYAAVITYRQAAPSIVNPSFTTEELARQICKHIVGMHPKTLGDISHDGPSKNKDDESKLLFQPFVMDESLTVNDFLVQNSLEIGDFIRFECGEIIPTNKQEQADD